MAIGLAAQFAVAGDVEPPFERGLEFIRNELLLARSGLVALEVAAHPGDEDGATLSYLRRSLGAETHACFMTRGEGDENETGPEWGAKLAVLRTRETEEACGILGAKAWYLNLPDFGFSKSADETLQVWGHDKALSQLVRVIRIVKPHVVFTNERGRDARATPDGKGDGHRVATVRLLLEAFAAAADEKKLPEQMKEDGTKPWAVSKLYVGCGEEKATLSFDAATLDPVSGLHTAEIAVCALAKHASLGEASHGVLRRPEPRDLLLAKSRLPKTDNEKGMLDALPSATGKTAAAVDAALKLLNPEAMKDGSLARAIGSACAALAQDAPGDEPRLGHLHAALGEAAGIKIATYPDGDLLMVGQGRDVTVRVTDLGPLQPTLEKLEFVPESPEWKCTVGTARQHGGFTSECSLSAGRQAYPTYPPENYIADRIETRTPVRVRVVMKAADTTFALTRPVPLELAPRQVVTISPDPVLVFDDPDHGDDVLVLTRFRMQVTNYFRLETMGGRLYAGIVPQDGVPVDKAATFLFWRQGETQSAEFRFMAPVAQLNKGDIEVPTTTWTGETNFGGTKTGGANLGGAKARLRRVPLRISGPLQVGLVKGTGDDLLNALTGLAGAGLGMTLQVLSPDDLRAADLNGLHTIVLDTHTALRRADVLDAKSRLRQFMIDGGNVVCLYHKDTEWNKPEPPKSWPRHFDPRARRAGEIAEHPIELSGERVADENAEVRILQPEHPLLLTPCKIWAQDFKGWVQERGAYFPKKWGPEYTALLSCNDPGEKPLDGGLLVSDVGAGSFIYTSYAWHLQLRAGVPGAYRLLANMLSYPRVRRGAR